MSRYFNRAFNHVVMIEGGYVDDPLDSGGKTKYGITEDVAREYGYNRDMKDLPLSVAEGIYEEKYWSALMLDDIADRSYDIASEIFDTAVNMGNSRAVTFLQRSLNVLNNREKYYSDLSVDGIMGKRTLSAFNSYMNVRNDHSVLLKMLNCLQGAFYIDLAERREKDESFVYGWFRTRIGVN